jgi:hypothetical protein
MLLTSRATRFGADRRLHAIATALDPERSAQPVMPLPPAATIEPTIAKTLSTAHAA